MWLDDVVFETGGSKESFLLPWANRIVTEICHEMDVRTLLTSDSATMAYLTTTKSLALPTNFMKYDERFLRVYSGDTEIEITGLETLLSYDPDQSDTTSSAYPVYVAIEGGIMYPYPLFAGTLTLKNYFRYPTDMATSSDVPAIPDDTMRTDLIVAGVIGKYGYPALNETIKAGQFYNISGGGIKSGRFFELLALYRVHISANSTVWTNRGRFY